MRAPAAMTAAAVLAFTLSAGAAETPAPTPVAGPPPLRPGSAVYMSPFGGYAPVNYNKKVQLLDPDGKGVSTRPGDLSFPLMDLIRRAERTIDIACYLYGVFTPEHTEIAQAARRGVKIRLFLDPSIKDKNEVPVIQEAVDRIREDRLPIEVKIIDPALAEKATGLPFKTMHEKFGIIDGVHVFTGSANIETGANVKYTEDRFFFLHNPGVAADFQAEFERLWAMGTWLINPRGIPEETGKADPATRPPAAAAGRPSTGGIESRFNSVERLEKYVKAAFSEGVARAQGGAPATIDIMIFSFTSPAISDSLLRIARDYPSVKIRIIANLSQLFREPTSVMPDIEAIASGRIEGYQAVAERRKAFIKDPEERKPAVETELKGIISEYRRRPLPNVEVKYKWFPSFSWDDTTDSCEYDHFHPKSSLLHHKAALINGETLVTGSYNWSNYAETKNLENLTIVRGAENRHLVEGFAAEFEAMWNDPALTKTSSQCRAMKDAICAEMERLRGKSPAEKGPAGGTGR